MLTNKIYSFALSGGPHGGKTSAIPFLQKKLKEYGADLIVVGETASEMWNDGIRHGEVPVIPYQNELFVRSLKKEEAAKNEAKILSEKSKVVILYDRGLMDGKSYMKPEDFYQMISNYGYSEKTILEKYDAIFHLVSVACGAEELLSNNNEARTENAEEMRELEVKTYDAWKSHTKRFIYDNKTDFTGKLERVWEDMKKLLDEE